MYKKEIKNLENQLKNPDNTVVQDAIIRLQILNLLLPSIDVKNITK